MRSSLTRARRSAPNKRRRAQWRMVKPVKQACSDTIEETVSSIDDAVAQRKRARFYKGSSPCPIIHLPSPPHHHLPFHDSSSHGTPPFIRRLSRIQSSLVGTCSAEQPGPRRVRWNSCRRGGKSRTRHKRQGLDGSRVTPRQPQTDQQSWRLSAEWPGLLDG